MLLYLCSRQLATCPRVLFYATSRDSRALLPGYDTKSELGSIRHIAPTGVRVGGTANYGCQGHGNCDFSGAAPPKVVAYYRVTYYSVIPPRETLADIGPDGGEG